MGSSTDKRRSNFVGVEGPASWMLAAGAGNRDAILRPLGDQTPLEMRDRAKDVEDQLAGVRVSVDPFLQAEEGNATPFEHGDRGQQFAE
jgi:hypothetical protein